MNHSPICERSITKGKHISIFLSTSGMGKPGGERGGGEEERTSHIFEPSIWGWLRVEVPDGVTAMDQDMILYKRNTS